MSTSSAPLVVEPDRVLTGQQRPRRCEERDLSGAPRTPEVPLRDRRLRPVHRVRCDLDVHRGSPFRQGGGRGEGETQTVQREIGEEQAALASGELGLDPSADDEHRERAAELDLDAGPTPPQHNPKANAYTLLLHKEPQWPKQITCECGHVAVGETDDEVIDGRSGST